MSATFTWSINTLATLQEPKENYVVRAMWSVTGEQGKHTDSRGGITQFEIKENDNNFVSFENLTEKIVIDWVKEKIGNDAVANIEFSIQQQLDKLKNPQPVPVDVPLPWNK